MLGPVGLRLDGHRMELGSDKERIVLASLALDVGRSLSMDSLIDRLWDGQTPAHARDNAHTYVSRIRKHLRRAGPSKRMPRIISRAHTYVLQAEGDSIDWHLFQRIAGTSTVGDDQRTVEILTRAEQLWQDEPLTGLPGLWAETVRRTLTERRLRATVSRIAARLRLGHFEDLVSELSALADQHPGDETLLGQLMLAYYGSGRYTEALRVHQQARHLLMAEYGARPGPELNRIHQGILDHVPTHDLTGGSTAPSTTPLSLRSPASTQLAPRNLPHQPPLVGRSTEIRALTESVDTTADGSVISLEAVSGMAGVGKTAIAIRTADRLARRFPDGQLYVDMRAHSPAQEPLSPSAALATLLRLLGAPAQAIPVDLEEQIVLWQNMLAERRTIIVLDDAANSAQIIPLLPGNSASLVITTSRRHLTGIPYARTVALDVLPTPDAITLFRRFAGDDRTSNLREVRRIIDLCGHLPLAIELVASRFRARPSWTLRTLSERLARNPGRLAEIRDADNEMTRAFDLSYHTLTDAQRTAFRRLGLHPGADFTADVAAAMLDLSPGDTERLLEDLLACHLLRELTPDRYRYHDLLREYARLLVISEDSEQERNQVVRRLTDFYIEAADRADRLVYPRRMRRDSQHNGARAPVPNWPDPDSARSWLTAERANLLAAAENAHTYGHPERAAQLAYALAGFLDAECHWQDAETALQHAVTHWAETGPQPALCRALLCLSTTHANTGRYTEAAETGERALAIARTTGDSEAEAEALRIAGTLNWHLGENLTALRLLQKSFAIQDKSGNAWEKARIYNNIAITLLFLGEHDRALDHFQKALAGFTETADKTSSARTLNNVGDMYRRKGDQESARRSFEEAMSFLETTGNRYDQATVRTNLASVLTELGDAATALPLHQESLLEFRSLGDRKSQADTLIGIGEAYRKRGDNEKALICHLDALKVATTIGAGHQMAQAHRCLGRTNLAMGKLDVATEHLQTAVATAARIHDLDEIVEAHIALADVRVTLGQDSDISAILQQGLGETRTLDPREMNILSSRLAEIGNKMSDSTVEDDEPSEGDRPTNVEA
ncbi:transcriptional regulator [Streptomyces scopuliridis RB72]|uniref:Transcriptional regulator n=2 Tax=Streptomyces scopuliridis TaxID=452529 RepID=A0A2T7SN71_9ACTN|nr:transcriptional regulator [Streptomyces scopuliridis RB72]